MVEKKDRKEKKDKVKKDKKDKKAKKEKKHKKDIPVEFRGIGLGTVIVQWTQGTPLQKDRSQSGVLS